MRNHQLDRFVDVLQKAAHRERLLLSISAKMDISQIKGIIRDILAKELDMDRALVVDGLSSDDTEVWDSTTHVEIVFKLEESFGIELEIEEIEGMYSFERIVKTIEAKT